MFKPTFALAAALLPIVTTPATQPDEEASSAPVLREEVRVGAFLARRFDVGWSSRIELLPVADPSRPSFVLTGRRLTLGTGEEGRRFGIGNDVNGDGTPDLIVSEWSGGAHCCTRDYVISLADDPRVLDTIYAEHSDGRTWEDLDGDGRPEVILNDWVFAYWATSFAGSPAPEVILTWRGGRFRPAEHLMVEPPPTNEELGAMAADLRKWTGKAGREGVGEVMRAALGLLYSGNREQAWRLFELAWDPAFERDREQFVADFRNQLEKSRFWPEIKYFQPAAAQPENDRIE